MSGIVRGSLDRWTGGILLLCGLTLLAGTIALAYNDWTFAREAKPADGTVVTKQIRTTRTRQSRSPANRYEVTYRFTVEGQTFGGRGTLSRDKWEGLREGRPVEVFYRPRNPQSNRLAGDDAWLLRIVMGAAGSVLAVFGGGPLVRSIRHSRLAGCLQQSGVPARRRVTGLHARNLTVNDVSLWRLGYEYADFQGRRYQNTVDLSEDDDREWKAGDVGQVRYDPSQPSQSSWLGRHDSG